MGAPMYVKRGYWPFEYFLHGPFCARWKDGSCGRGNWIKPSARGSGKFGTPFARMQFANLSDA